MAHTTPEGDIGYSEWSWDVKQDDKAREREALKAGWPVHIGDEIDAMEMLHDTAGISPEYLSEQHRALSALLYAYASGYIEEDTGWTESVARAYDQHALSVIGEPSGSEFTDNSP